MIVGIFGNLSSGKSALAVKYCYDDWVKNKSRVISNIYLDFPSVLLTIDELYAKALSNPEFFRDSILYTDEIHNIIDARRSSSLLNMKFTQWITQLGKLDCRLIYTSQILSSQIDLRVRELCDVYIFCMRFILKNGVWQPAIFEPRIVNDPVMFKCNMVVKVFGGLSYEYFTFDIDLSEYFKLYKTREIVYLDRELYLRH